MAQDVTTELDESDISGGNTKINRTDFLDYTGSLKTLLNNILNGLRKFDALFFASASAPTAPTGDDVKLYNDAGDLKIMKDGVDDQPLLPLTTLGDLYTHDGDTPVRLPVGADDEVLIADSTEPTGLRWAASTGADILQVQVFS